MTEDLAGIIAIEQHRADGITANWSSTVGQHQPAVIDLDRRPTVPDMDQLPRLGGLGERVDVIPVVPVLRESDRVRLPIEARECTVPAVDVTREEGQALIANPWTGQCHRGEGTEIIRLQDPGSDTAAVIGGVARSVAHWLIGVEQSDEPCIFHAASLIRCRRPQDPFTDIGLGVKVDLITAPRDIVHGANEFVRRRAPQPSDIKLCQIRHEFLWRELVWEHR